MKHASAMQLRMNQVKLAAWAPGRLDARLGWMKYMLCAKPAASVAIVMTSRLATYLRT